MGHLIDCHVLTMPDDRADWAAQLRADLDAEPVHQHWLPGIEGRFGMARAKGFALGCAPFLSFADPDDRVVGGTFSCLLAALLEHPGAPFAWAGEQRVDSDLVPIGEPTVWPDGYDHRRHRNHMTYCHGVVLIRRAVLMPALGLLRACGVGADGVLLGHLARVHSPLPPDALPVHVPIVGRLWRQHQRNYHRTYSASARARDQRLLGVTPQYLHITQAPAGGADR